MKLALEFAVAKDRNRSEAEGRSNFEWTQRASTLSVGVCTFRLRPTWKGRPSCSALWSGRKVGLRARWGTWRLPFPLGFQAHLAVDTGIARSWPGGEEPSFSLCDLWFLHLPLPSHLPASEEISLP